MKDEVLKMIVLIDNNPHPEIEYKTEHGLSFYFEVDGCKWLFDVGASENYYDNALTMGIEIKDVDFLILSHAHNDHTGGLEHFLGVNKKAKIILSSQIKGKTFYSYRRITKRNIGINYSVVNSHIERFIFVEDDKQLSENIFLVCKIPIDYQTPAANKTLFIKDSSGEKPDEFKHEMAVGINAGAGIIILSPCSHNGVLNILDAMFNYTKQSKIISFIGGTHLINSDDKNKFETDEEIKYIAKTITKKYPSMQFITGHCTGTNAQNVFSEIMKNNFKTFYSGDIL